MSRRVPPLRPRYTPDMDRVYREEYSPYFSDDRYPMIPSCGQQADPICPPEYASQTPLEAPSPLRECIPIRPYKSENYIEHHGTQRQTSLAHQKLTRSATLEAPPSLRHRLREKWNGSRMPLVPAPVFREKVRESRDMMTTYSNWRPPLPPKPPTQSQRRKKGEWRLRRAQWHAPISHRERAELIERCL